MLLAALLGAAVSSVTDIKRGIIPNKLTLPLIGFGILGNLLLALSRSDPLIFVTCLSSIAAIFIFGYLFWILGGWSAGDVKELLFIAALVPRYPGILEETFNPALGPYPFVFTVLVNTFLSIFPLVALYSVGVALLKTGLKEFFKPLENFKEIGVTALVFLGAVALSTVTKIPVFILIIILLLIRNQRQRILLSLVLIVVYAVFSPAPFSSKAAFLATYFLGTIVIFTGLALLLNSFRLFRYHALQEEKPISELEEGDVLAEEIYMLEGQVFRDSRGILEKAKEIAKRRDFPILKKRTVAGTRAAGVTMGEVEKLKSLVEEGRLEDRIKVKKSMPFAPVIFLGLIISLTLGDLGVIVRRLYG